MSNGKLAYHGGKPVRPNKKYANPLISSKARADIIKVLNSGSLARFYGGMYVKKFEEEYALRFKRKYAIAVNSGTSALHVAYLSMGIEEFSEVLVPANAYISAISALIQCNLVPIIVDIDPRSWVMDVEDIQRKITQRTRAIVPVHMYGQPCPMDEITAIAKEHNLLLIEDCGQSHGALWNSKLTGTFGKSACFSICCRKSITAGEGGVVITDSKQIADKARAYAHKGKGPGWFDYLYMGFSYNMTEIQAIIALYSLRKLNIELKQRQRLADYLKKELGDLGAIYPVIPSGATHSYFKFNIMLPDNLSIWRNEIVDAIQKENVGVDPSHPYVLDINWLRNQEPTLYKLIKHKPDYSLNVCPNARNILSRQIGLEIGPGLRQKDMKYTVAAVKKVINWYRKNKSL